jgi:hypothetical protein
MMLRVQVVARGVFAQGNHHARISPPTSPAACATRGDALISSPVQPVDTDRFSYFYRAFHPSVARPLRIEASVSLSKLDSN